MKIYDHPMHGALTFQEAMEIATLRCTHPSLFDMPSRDPFMSLYIDASGPLVTRL